MSQDFFLKFKQPTLKSTGNTSSDKSYREKSLLCKSDNSKKLLKMTDNRMAK